MPTLHERAYVHWRNQWYLHPESLNQRRRIFTSGSQQGRFSRQCTRSGSVERWPMDINAIVLHCPIISMLSGHFQQATRIIRPDGQLDQKGIHKTVVATAAEHEEHDVYAGTRTGRAPIDESGNRVFGNTPLKIEEDFERHFDYIHYNPVKHRSRSLPK